MQSAIACSGVFKGTLSSLITNLMYNVRLSKSMMQPKRSTNGLLAKNGMHASTTLAPNKIPDW